MPCAASSGILADGDLPGPLAGVQVDRGQRPPRRLDGRIAVRIEEALVAGEAEALPAARGGGVSDIPVLAGAEQGDDRIDRLGRQRRQTGHPAGALADDPRDLGRRLAAADVDERGDLRRRAGQVVAMAGGALLQIELPGVGRGDGRRQHARARHLGRADVEEARRRIERRPAPPAAAVESRKDDGLDADRERHELPVAAEAPERLDRTARARPAFAASACPRSAAAGRTAPASSATAASVTPARRPRRWPERAAPRSGRAACPSPARTARRSPACWSAPPRRCGGRRGSPSPAPAAPADRDPRCRDGRSGNATAARRWRRRARAACWRRGCRRGRSAP